MAKKPNQRTVGERVVRATKWAMLLFVLGLVVVIAGGFYLLRRPPSYWQVVDASDPKVQQQADAMFNRVMDEATQVRQAQQEWELELQQDEINAWLATRSKQWMANQGYDRELSQRLENIGLPGELATNFRNLMINIEGDTVSVAAEVVYDGYAQVVSVDLERQTLPDGSATLTMGSIKGGSLPLPMEKLQRAAQKEFGSVEAAKAEATRRAATKIRQANIVLPLDEHRQVKVNDLKLEGGRAVLVCQTISDGQAP